MYLPDLLRVLIMAPNMVEQSANMLNARFALDKNPPAARMPPKPIRETIKYPKLAVTDADNPCLDPSQSFEHVLSCGHLIATTTSNESCAPNCHHVADESADLDRSLKHKKAMKMKNGNKVSDKHFYCDACVETEIEVKLLSDFSSANAEERRIILRANEAQTRKKDTKFRKCYIGQKITSVQCYSDGTLSSRYVPRKKRHPFDTAMPRTGDNMFEDIDPNPKEEEKRKQSTNTDKKIGGTMSDNPLSATIDVRVPTSTRAANKAGANVVLSLQDNHGIGFYTPTERVVDQDSYETTTSLWPKRPERSSRASRSLLTKDSPKRKSYCMDEDDDDESDEEGETLLNGHWLRRPIAMTARKMPKKKARKT